MRKAAGLTITEVGTAINLKDPSLIEAWENGRIAVPFESDPAPGGGARPQRPDRLRHEVHPQPPIRTCGAPGGLGVGKLLIQSAREREFANIYRADDEARKLSDEEFAEVLTFTRAAFEMAMAFRGRSSKRRADLTAAVAVVQAPTYLLGAVENPRRVALQSDRGGRSTGCCGPRLPAWSSAASRPAIRAAHRPCRWRRLPRD
jgi:hypothetical protein